MKLHCILAATAFLTLAACSQPAAPPVQDAPAEPAAPSPADFHARYSEAIASASADRSTPEAALRGWWAANDAMKRLGCEAWPLVRAASRDWADAQTQSLDEMVSALLTGEAETSIRRGVHHGDEPCVATTFDHTIQSTQMSGESRAVITVLTHNTTPLPEGFTLGEIRFRQRRDGARYRYTLLKDETGWRISAIEINPYFTGWNSLTRPTLEPEGVPYSETVP